MAFPLQATEASPPETKIEDLAKINIFIGKNNCGKSNVLRFLEWMGRWMTQKSPNSRPLGFDPLLDYSMAATRKAPTVGLQLKRTGHTASLFKSVAALFGANWAESLPRTC